MVVALASGCAAAGLSTVATVLTPLTVLKRKASITWSAVFPPCVMVPATICVVNGS